MKKRTVIMISVIAAACIVLGAIGIIAANAETRWYKQKAETDAYAFPEFANLQGKTYEQVIEHFQIPEDVLKSMSTEGLIESCLDYPLFWERMVFSNESAYSGFMETRSEFNGLQELFKRKDAPDKLVRTYIEASPERILKSDESAVLRMRYFQYILAQDEVLEGLTADGRRLLLEECVKKLEQYSKNYRDSFAADPVLMLAARICKRDCEAFRGLMVDEPWLEGLANSGRLLAGQEDGVRGAIEVVNEYIRSK